jgi:hypothetical protein
MTAPSKLALNSAVTQLDRGWAAGRGDRVDDDIVLVGTLIIWIYALAGFAPLGAPG